MKPNKKDNAKLAVLILPFSIILFAFGLFLSIKMMLKSEDAVLEEHDLHIYHLATSVDQNLANELIACRDSIESFVDSDLVAFPEKDFLDNGDYSGFSSIFKKKNIIIADYVYAIVIAENEEIIYSDIYPEDTAAFSYYDEDDGDIYRIFTDNYNQNEYLAITVSPDRNSLIYYALIDLEQFYHKLVSNSVYDYYWTVFYDKGSGLFLHNDYDAPVIKFMTRQDIVDADDGFTLIDRYEQMGEIGTDGYDYYDSDGVEHHNRITMIPSALSQNSNFAVAISVYEDDIIKPAEERFWKTFFGSMLITIASAITLFFLLYSRNKEKELTNELKDLERKNELTNNLLKQREELAHHQKLETIGTLTAGIAHEINNLMSPIMGNSLLIIENTADENSDTYDNALEIYNASTKAKELILKISKLSRKNTSAKATVFTPEYLIDSALSIVAASIPKNIEVVKDMRSKGKICGDESDLGHMLINLLINAVQAMTPNDGVLTVASWDADDMVYISVSDTGKGIPKEIIDSIFEPFVTTKEVGKGTGLGLAIAQRTANNHGGTIKAENLSQGGARFTVSLKAYQ